MRGDIGLDSGLLTVLFDQFPEALAAHAPAVHVDKQRLLVRPGDDARADVG